MCGIFGYIGVEKSEDAVGKVIAGLGRLSYRGYDSWGVAAVAASEFVVTRVGQRMVG